MATGDAALTVALEEYKVHATAVAARVDLQQRNAHLNLTLVSVGTGYLAAYLRDHCVHELLTSETALLIVLLPLLSMVLVWRHLDHDKLIIESVSYVQKVLRPTLVGCGAGKTALTYDDGLAKTRAGQDGARWWSRRASEDTLMLAFITLFLILGAVSIVVEPRRVAGAAWLFYLLEVVAVVLFLRTVTLGRQTRADYRGLTIVETDA